MNTVFSCTVSGHHSLGSDYSRYYDTTLTLTSGLQLPAGAQINSVTLNCSNITVWASNLVNQAHIRLDGVDFTSAQWSPRGDNQSITKSCYTTSSIYAGKNTFTFFCGWDSTPTGSAWCSFRSGGTLTLTINWDATDDINSYTQK